MDDKRYIELQIEALEVRIKSIKSDLDGSSHDFSILFCLLTDMQIELSYWQAKLKELS